MNSRKIFLTFMSVSVLAIIGLVAAQVFWFSKALTLKQEQFKEKVYVVLNKIGFEISNDDVLQEDLSLLISGEHKIVSTAGNNFPDYFNQKVQNIIGSNDIDSDYVLGFITEEECNSMINSKPENITFDAIEPLGCFIPDTPTSYYIYLSFPDKHQLLLAESSSMLMLSIVLILILLVSMAYLHKMFVDQKKISAIKNEFINNLTHEFKTPLASISLATKVIKEGSAIKSNSDDALYVRLIAEETKKLENHIDKVLQIATIDSGKFTLDINPVDLNQIIGKVVPRFSIMLGEKSGNIKKDLQSKNSTIKGDEMHIYNMVYNLIDNAIKYNNTNPEITLSTVDVDGGVMFSISDNGIGIDADQQKHIFEKFYRFTEGNIQKTRGFGLGLSYVKSIVDAHKGVLSFTSKVNIGTEFKIMLPYG